MPQRRHYLALVLLFDFSPLSVVHVHHPVVLDRDLLVLLRQEGHFVVQLLAEFVLRLLQPAVGVPQGLALLRQTQSVVHHQDHHLLLFPLNRLELFLQKLSCAQHKVMFEHCHKLNKLSLMQFDQIGQVPNILYYNLRSSNITKTLDKIQICKTLGKTKELLEGNHRFQK